MGAKARIGLALTAGAVMVSPIVGCTPPPPHFSSCKLLNLRYPHGVGKVNAVDHVRSGKPVTNFYRSDAIYNANTARDADQDGVACEKH